ncbi:MAG: hypothetical protein LBL50_02595 [Candidatus Margulisbacteria bacterium]|nr:hypothetical protein [Candidatus Margulisiibacteriota bacterium]
MVNASIYTDVTDTDFKGENYNIDTGKNLLAEGMRNALHTKENVTNKTDTIDSSNSSSDTQYPSVKAVYDSLNEIDNSAVHKTRTETITGIKTFGTTDAAAEPLLGMAKTTDAINSGTKFATEAQVYNLAQILATALLPVGMILAMSVSSWTNASAAFKSKWQVCDGTGGTPDLRGRFLRGGTVSDPLIGDGKMTLTIEHLPSHTHGGSTTGGSHGHNFLYRDRVNGYKSTTSAGYLAGLEEGGGHDEKTYLNAVWDSPNRTATSSVQTSSSHVHSVSIDYSGSGQAFDVIPAFYTVIYIMKVA